MAVVAVVLQELTADNIDICATFIDDAIDETDEFIPFWILFVAESIDDEALSKAALTLLILVDNLESEVWLFSELDAHILALASMKNVNINLQLLLFISIVFTI